jgi:hypothetical protein
MTQETKKPSMPKLGEILVQYGIITPSMLRNALKRQSQIGGQIGSILIEMGYINTDTLLDFLSKQFGIPSANLFKIDVPQRILKILPIEKIREYKVIPLAIGEQLTLAMINPKDYIAIRDIEFLIGRQVNPIVVPAFQMEAALKSLESGESSEIKGSEIEKPFSGIGKETEVDIKTLLGRVVESNATDLQLTAGVPPSLRVGN